MQCCILLEFARSLVYYHMNKEDINENKEDDILEEEIKQIFKKSKNNYGSRKIKKELEKKG